MASAPIILVPGFWLGAWAWDEVAALLRADGHDVTALTLPGLESKDADRSGVTFEDHVDAIVGAVRAAAAPAVLALHSATGFSGYAASDVVPERIAAIVYVDTAPGKGALDPGFEGDEKPMVWDEIKAEENLDGLSEEQLATFRERAVPEPAGLLRETARASPTTPATTSRRRSSPPASAPRTTRSTRSRASRLGVPRRAPRAARRDLGGPADQPLADVVAPGGHRADHRRRGDARRGGRMTATLLDDALAHHVWATQRLIDACTPLTPDQLTSPAPGTYGSILDTFRHLVGTDCWYLTFFRDGPRAIEEGAEAGADLQASCGRPSRPTARRGWRSWPQAPTARRTWSSTATGGTSTPRSASGSRR